MVKTLHRNNIKFCSKFTLQIILTRFAAPLFAFHSLGPCWGIYIYVLPLHFDHLAGTLTQIVVWSYLVICLVCPLMFLQNWHSRYQRLRISGRSTTTLSWHLTSTQDAITVSSRLDFKENALVWRPFPNIYFWKLFQITIM